MSIAQFLPSIHDKETVTCPRCNAPQYPRNGKCVRCQASLGVNYVALEMGDLLDPRSEDHSKQLARWIGDLLRILRKRRGICQSQLAKMATRIDRSCLSKAECGLVLTPLSKLLPLARAMGLTRVILRFEAIEHRAVPKSSCRRRPRRPFIKDVLSWNNPK